MEKQRARQTPQTQGGRVGDKISERIVHRILDWQSRNGNQLLYLRYQIFFQWPIFSMTNFKT